MQYFARVIVPPLSPAPLTGRAIFCTGDCSAAFAVLDGQLGSAGVLRKVSITALYQKQHDGTLITGDGVAAICKYRPFSLITSDNLPGYKQALHDNKLFAVRHKGIVSLCVQVFSLDFFQEYASIHLHSKG